MIKQIKIKAERIDAVTKLCFPPTSKSELELLKVLISFGSNNSITLTPDLSGQVMSAANLKQSLYNLSLHRLAKKGIITSVGKTKMFHPVYNNILDVEKILISFSENKS